MADSFTHSRSRGAHFGTSSLSASLNMSINVRAAVAIRRARMMLQERPAWLLDYEPYMAPLLPVGYVCKVRLAVCARTVNAASFTNSTRSVHFDVNNFEHRAAESQQAFKAKDNLKAFMKEWVVKPLRSCFFVSEEGRVWRPVRPGSRPANAAADAEDAYEQEIPMVAESVITPVHATAAQRALDQQHPLHVFIDLVFVADRPFCLAMLVLNKPLVYEGMAAWVKHVYVHVDDTLVYDSGDAALQLDVATHAGARAASGNTGATLRDAADDHVQQMRRVLPKYKSSLRKYILFTLDEKLLREVKKEAGL
ncbi:hypothetical protein STCU_10335 [Strigomonas culicis]|uniref:Uncharacterized protein n=1 Tax=Strigomonas culicis TaxID=28005 RepID=S9V4T1_9TRYP|nr:hypothetical protein STCU_10335 [Strigomonas culicis]|eukprot:EPY17895.1 hypothetical protein STCU_10335 [Strigomonas culicis]